MRAGLQKFRGMSSWVQPRAILPMGTREEETIRFKGTLPRWGEDFGKMRVEVRNASCGGGSKLR